MGGVEHLHRHRVPEKPGDKRQREHEREGQSHRAVKDNDGHDIKMSVKHPVERRDEDLDHLGEENENDEKEEEYHERNDEVRNPKDEPMTNGE